MATWLYRRLPLVARSVPAAKELDSLGSAGWQLLGGGDVEAFPGWSHLYLGKPAAETERAETPWEYKSLGQPTGLQRHLKAADEKLWDVGAMGWRLVYCVESQRQYVSLILMRAAGERRSPEWTYTRVQCRFNDLQSLDESIAALCRANWLIAGAVHTAGWIHIYMIREAGHADSNSGRNYRRISVTRGQLERADSELEGLVESGWQLQASVLEPRDLFGSWTGRVHMFLARDVADSQPSIVCRRIPLDQHNIKEGDPQLSVLGEEGWQLMHVLSARTYLHLYLRRLAPG